MHDEATRFVRVAYKEDQSAESRFTLIETACDIVTKSYAYTTEQAAHLAMKVQGQLHIERSKLLRKNQKKCKQHRTDAITAIDNNISEIEKTH